MSSERRIWALLRIVLRLSSHELRIRLLTQARVRGSVRARTTFSRSLPARFFRVFVARSHEEKRKILIGPICTSFRSTLLCCLS